MSFPSSGVRTHYGSPVLGGDRNRGEAENLAKAEKIHNSLWQRHEEWTALTELQFLDIRPGTPRPDDHMSKPGILMETFTRRWWAADIELQMEESPWAIHVHSVCVCAHSLFFRRIVCDKEPPLSIDLRFHALTPKGLEEAIEFMYCGRLPISTTSLPRQLQAASTLEIPAMMEKLEKYLLNLTLKHSDYVLYSLQLSVLYFAAGNIRKRLLEIAAENFAALVKSPEFGMIGLDCLLSLLSADLRTSEKEKFDASLSWLKINKGDIGHCQEVLDCIDFNGMTRMDLIKCEEAAQDAATQGSINIKFALRQRTVETNWRKGYKETKENFRYYEPADPLAREQLTRKGYFIPKKSEYSELNLQEESSRADTTADSHIDTAAVYRQYHDSLPAIPDDGSESPSSNRSTAGTKSPKTFPVSTPTDCPIPSVEPKTPVRGRRSTPLRPRRFADENGNELGPKLKLFLGLEKNLPSKL